MGLKVFIVCFIPTTRVVGYILSPLTGLFTLYRFAARARFLFWPDVEGSGPCSI
jgi:hypothetical protein